METKWSLKILFDGACPLCSAEMHFLKRKDKYNKILLEDISKLDKGASYLGKTSLELNRYIHAQLPDGEIISGMEVFRKAYKVVGLGFVLWPTSLPIIKQISDLGYRIFAKNRIRIGQLFGRKVEESCVIEHDK